MGIRQRLSDAIAGKGNKNIVTQERSGMLFINALCSNYENFWAQVRPMINDMKMVEPYGVGRNGGRLAEIRTPELSLLKEPNYEMGWAEFMDAAFATWLTEEELNIHVHKNGRGKVIGYSILPVGCRQINYQTGGYRFQVTTTEGIEILTEDEVATLRFSRSPRNIDKGVSPGTSAVTWAQIDDLIAQYQKAFLENGAIPASITTIKASTKEKYEEARRDLEKGLKGAKNRNKTVYVWRQYLPTGDEADQIEVKTIQGPNSTLALKDINQIITDRLNKAIGVSNFIMGDDSSAKYDNAELSDFQFTKRRVYPALLSFWGQFQHELDRITGGLGYAIQFDLELPELTDRKKVQAETAKINNETLTSMITAGARPSAAVEALGLPEEWLPVADGIYDRVLSAQTESVPNVLSADSKITKIHAKSKDSTSTVSHNHKELNACECHNTTKDAAGYAPVFSETETAEKAIYDQLMRIVESAFAGTDIPQEEVRKIIDEILGQEATTGANTGAKAISALEFGDDVTNAIKTQLENGGYHLPDDFYAKMDRRSDLLIEQLADESKAIATDVLKNAEAEGLTANEIEQRLSDAMPRYRAELIARNETVNAFRAGRLENDQYLAETYGLKMGAVWHCTKDGKTCPVCEEMDGKIKTCPVCEEMDGKMVPLGQPFPTVDVEVELKDGSTKTMTWTHDVWNDDGRLTNAHPNCRCYFDEVVLDD